MKNNQFGFEHGTLVGTNTQDPAISVLEFSNWGLMGAGGSDGAASYFINPRSHDIKL